MGTLGRGAAAQFFTKAAPNRSRWKEKLFFVLAVWLQKDEGHWESDFAALVNRWVIT